MKRSKITIYTEKKCGRLSLLQQYGGIKQFIQDYTTLSIGSHFLCSTLNTINLHLIRLQTHFFFCYDFLSNYFWNLLGHVYKFIPIALWILILLSGSGLPDPVKCLGHHELIHCRLLFSPVSFCSKHGSGLNVNRLQTTLRGW